MSPRLYEYEAFMGFDGWAGWLRAVRRVMICMLALSASGLWAQGVAGVWQGSLPVERYARIVVRISAADSGGLRGVFQRVDVEAEGAAFSSVSFRAPELEFSADVLGVSFRGELAVDGASLRGTWTQGKQSYVLLLNRVAPEAAWRHGDAAALGAMSASADPAFEVATIKPADPQAKGIRYEIRTRQFRAVNASVVDLMRFAFQVRPRQISGIADWTGEEKFDIAAEPDTPGLPNVDQYRTMVRKLLAERFGLKFHRVEQSFLVYALTIAGGQPKIAPGDPSLGLDGYLVGENQPGGDTLVRFSSESMQEFVGILMNFVDRQVVDETGLTGRFDFVMVVPTAVLQGPDASEKAAAFLSAVQPLGFRLVAKKANLDVLVVDQVERPSPN